MSHATKISKFNHEQQAVVDHVDGPIQVCAVAGSGKTGAITGRIAALLNAGVDPKRILAVTFSRDAAGEMNDRLAKIAGPKCGARVGTFHSVALEILRSELPEYADWEIQASKYRLCIKQAVGFQEMEWKDADPTVIESYISRCMCDLAEPATDAAFKIAQDLYAKTRKPSRNPEKLYLAYARTEELRKEKHFLTFDVMLTEAVLLLQRDPSALSRWQSRWDFVIADEDQDTNKAQKLLAELLAAVHRNLCVVGDEFQCHPAGTLILTDEGEMPVEELYVRANESGASRPRPTVKGWNRRAQKMVSGRAVEVAVRRYTGRMHYLTVGSQGLRVVPMTSNHKVLARWTDTKVRTCVTYLMWREGYGFRVGWCQLFTKRANGNICHLVQRAKLEKADKVWVLKTHASRTEASIHESIVAASYGLPTATFEPIHNAQHYTAESLRTLFDALQTTNGQRGTECLHDHGRDVAYPLWPWPEHQSEGVGGGAFRRGTYFPVYASNVLSGLMALPLPSARNVWATVLATEVATVRDEQVFSLNVEKDHSYAANGVVVLNCIYEWRGASPALFRSFSERWPGTKVVGMARNYRCGSAIIEIANRVLQGLESTLPMIAERGTEGLVTCSEFADFDAEARAISAKVKQETADGRPLKDFAVLYRTQAQSRALEEAFLADRVPYVIRNACNFYERAEVSDLLAYLRIAAGRGEAADVTRCLNRPFRFLGKAFLGRVEAEAATTPKGAKPRTWVEVVRAVIKTGQGLQSRQTTAALGWCDLLDEVARRIAAWNPESFVNSAGTDGSPSALLELISSRTGYCDWLLKEEGDENVENSRVSNVRELIRVATRFRSVTEFLGFIDDTIQKAREAARKNESIDAVALTTLHSSKGLEWPVVFLIGANEGILPHARAENTAEEQRLFYVGVTRARDELHLSCVRQAVIGGKVRPLSPSSFLLQAELTPVDIDERANQTSDPSAN